MVFLGGHPATNHCVCSVCVCVFCLSDIYYRDPSWYQGNFLPVITADTTGHSNLENLSSRTKYCQQTNNNIYKGQAAVINKLLFEYEQSRELEIINNSNFGGFYRFLNNKLTCKSGVGPLRLDSGILTTDDNY